MAIALDDRKRREEELERVSRRRAQDEHREAESAKRIKAEIKAAEKILREKMPQLRPSKTSSRPSTR